LVTGIPGEWPITLGRIPFATWDHTIVVSDSPGGKFPGHHYFIYKFALALIPFLHEKIIPQKIREH